MKAVVFGGTGSIGNEGAEAIGRRKGITKVIVAGSNFEKAQRVATRIGEHAEAAYVDLASREAIAKVINGADLILNFAGPTYLTSPPVVEAAIEARVNYADVTDDPEVFESLSALDKAAKDAGITALCGFGLGPGLTNLFAMHAAHRLEKVSDIRIAYAVSLLPRPTDIPGPGITGHRLELFTSNCVVFKDGELAYLPGGSDVEMIEWPEPLGTLESSIISHPEPMTLPRYIKGVRNVTVKLAYPRRATELLMNLGRLGLASKTPIEVDGKPITPYQFSRHFFFTSEIFRQTEVWKGVMEDERAMGPSMSARVDIHGERNRRPTGYVYRFVSRDRSRPVYTPAVVGIDMVLSGKIKQRGVIFPEDLNIEYTNALLDEVKKSGVDWSSWEKPLH